MFTRGTSLQNHLSTKANQWLLPDAPTLALRHAAKPGVSSIQTMLLANNEIELESVLKSIDISVPRRSEGRIKEHTERYAIAHMLSALLGKTHLSYPLELVRRERPDFLLKVSGLEIGIEHTEAVPQNEAHKAVLRDKVDGPEVQFISLHHPIEPSKRAKHLIEEIQANHAGSGWTGDSVEREWSEAMLFFFEGKIKALAKEGFDRFQQNWLLIYDNWSLPAVDREKSSQYLFQELIESKYFDNFSSIFIITGSLIFEFSNSGIVQHEINDLWK